MTTPAAWFHNAIINGVQLLYSLALRGGPAAEVLPLTTTGWIETLWRGRAWSHDLDAPRLAAGFYSLAGACDTWPAPKQLLDHLPARPELQALPPPRPAMNAAQREQLTALRRRVTDALTTTPQARAPRPGGVRSYSPPAGGCDDMAAAGNLSAQQHAPSTERVDSREQ